MMSDEDTTKKEDAEATTGDSNSIHRGTFYNPRRLEYCLAGSKLTQPENVIHDSEFMFYNPFIDTYHTFRGQFVQ